MKNTKEFEALKALADSNFAMLDDGRTVYMTPTGEVRDTDTRLLLPADPIRAALYLKNKGKSSGTGLPSDVGAYKYMATDGDGQWQAEDRLAWKESKVESKTLYHLTETPTVVSGGVGYIMKSGNLIPDCVVGNTYHVECPQIGVDDDVVCDQFQTRFPRLLIEGKLQIDYSIMDLNTTFTRLDGGTFEKGETYDFIISEQAEVETVHTIPAEYLPEGVGWKKESVEEIFPEQTLEFAFSDGVYLCEIIPAAFNLTIGEKNIVVWDGTKYECIVKDDGDGNACIEYDGQDTTGDSFFIVSVANELNVFQTRSSSQSHTISITRIAETIHHIPAEYITGAPLTGNDMNKVLSVKYDYDNECLFFGLNTVGDIFAVFDDGELYDYSGNKVTIERLRDSMYFPAYSARIQVENTFYPIAAYVDNGNEIQLHYRDLEGTMQTVTVRSATAPK